MRKAKHGIAILLIVALIAPLFSMFVGNKDVQAAGNETIADVTQGAGGNTELVQGYNASDKYVVLSGHLKAETFNEGWGSVVALSVSGTTPFNDYGFQFVYDGPSGNISGIKLNEGNLGWDGTTVQQAKFYNAPTLRNLFTSAGLDVKVIRMNTWAYLLVDMGDGYVQLKEMKLPEDANTQLRLYNAGTGVSMSNIKVATGEEAVAKALDAAQMRIDANGSQVFDFNQNQWIVDATLQHDSENTNHILALKEQGNGVYNSIYNSSSDMYAVMTATLRINGAVDRNSYPSLYLYTGSGEQKFKLQYNPDGISTVLVADGGVTQDGVNIPTWQKYCAGSPLEQVFTNGGVEIKLVRMNTWAYLFAKTANGYELIAKRAVANGDVTNFAIFSEGLGSATYDVTNITVETGMAATIEAIEGTTIDLNDGPVYFPIDSVSWTLRGKATIADSGVLTSNYINNIILVGPDADRTKSLSLLSLFANGLHANWPKYDWAGQIKEGIGTLLASDGGEWLTWIRSGGTMYMQHSANGTDWNGYYSHGEAGDAAGGICLWSEQSGAEFTITELVKNDFEIVEDDFALVADSNGSKMLLNEENLQVNADGTYKVRWVRDGATLTMYQSLDGKAYEIVESMTIDEAASAFTMNGALEYGTTVKDLYIRVGQLAIEKAIWKGSVVTLGDQVGVNVYMDLLDDVVNDSKAYMQFTLPGTNHTEEKVMVSDAAYDEVSGYYVFSCGIAAKEMASDIKFKVVCGDATESKETVYQVKNYGETILNDTEGVYSGNDKAMVKAMLNYGAYAQQYFGYNTENLANAGMPEADRVVPMPKIGDSYEYTLNGTIDGITCSGTSLMQTTRTTLRHYFTLSEGQDIADYTFTCGERSLTPVQKGAYYYVDITEIVASKLGEMYVLDVKKGEATLSLSYSPYTNIKAIIEGSNYTQESKNMMASLYYYGECAKQYLQSNRPISYELNYSAELTSGGIYDGAPYNTSLFFRNDTILDNPDNFVLQVTDEDSEDCGAYYLYGTVDGLGAYRSTDLENWTRVSTAFTPVANSEIQYNLWAPEVIYDADTDLYYMFASGSKTQDGDKHLFVATSDNPAGPFNMVDTSKYLGQDSNTMKNWQCIDPSPFVGADGEKYLLFMKAYDDDNLYDAVWGMKMTNWTTPDYSTLTKLTRNGYLEVTGNEKATYEATKTRNEAPHMYVDNSNGDATYYLTMSINGLDDYTVIQAIGKSPLGPFRKLTEEEGGILLANDQLEWDHIKGTGHHCFVQAGEELFIFYHQQANREEGGSWNRTLAKDRIVFTENAKGQKVMVANGPTWSLQPKVEAYAEYKNIADEATVSVTNGANKAALTDGVLSMYKNVNFVKEFETSEEVTITLDFGTYREITALMVYNSKLYGNAFQSVKRVEFEYESVAYADGATTYIDGLPFDWESYKQATENAMRPGGSAVAVFEPLKVKRIHITLEVPSGQSKIAVSEIAILGK